MLRLIYSRAVTEQQKLLLFKWCHDISLLFVIINVDFKAQSLILVLRPNIGFNYPASAYKLSLQIGSSAALHGA